MSRPVIGLSCYLEQAKWGAWDVTAAVLPVWYLELFQQAGASVLLLTPDADPDPSVLDRVDGLVLVGGADVDSTLYGAKPHETADAPRITRDRTEMAYYRGAHDRGMPFLGVCRGLQIMAVCHGGALHQHLPDVSELVHRERPGQFSDHTATFAPGSHIAQAMGATETVVNSSHHQAVSDPGDLTVTGWAADGTIEVCEDPSAPFVVGVQWHPEHPDRRMADAGLINAFLEACVARRLTGAREEAATAG